MLTMSVSSVARLTLVARPGVLLRLMEGIILTQRSWSVGAVVMSVRLKYVQNMARNILGTSAASAALKLCSSVLARHTYARLVMATTSDCA